MSKAKAVGSALKKKILRKSGSKTALDSAVPKREKDVLARSNSDGTVAVMRLDNDEYFYTIDGLAAQIWLLIDGTRSLSEIKSSVISKHSPPTARFEKDFSSFINMLQSERLIRV